MTATVATALDNAAKMLARRVGLRPDPSMRGRLTRSVTEEARGRGLDVTTYVAALGTDEAALQGLLNRVTVQETAFFRDRAQLDALARHVLPTLGSPVTIWSAGCANGQEPYTLAMLLEEHGGADARIYATDVSTKALERTRRARYSVREIDGLTSARRARHLIQIDNEFEIVPALRSRIDVAFQNLVTDPPPFVPGTCDVIFCRNVLIYFDPKEIVRLLDRMAAWLAPGGWLFLGYSESLGPIAERFQLVRLGDVFVYRRRNTYVAATVPPRGVDVDASVTTRLGSRTSKPESTPTIERPVAKPPPTNRTLGDRSTVPHHTESASDAVRPAGTTDVLLAQGEAAVEAGDYASAIAAFRKGVYLDPQWPIAHLHLGLALEASGDATAARRAYAVARLTLESCDSDTIEASLDGYHPAELARLIDRKLAAP